MISITCTSVAAKLVCSQGPPRTFSTCMNLQNFGRTQTYFRISANNVDSGPTTLKGGTNGITVALSLGIDIKIIPVRKFINSGENFLDKPTLSAITEATKRPEAKLCLEFTLQLLSI